MDTYIQVNKKRQIPWHGFDKYFKYVDETQVNIKVLCLLCLPSKSDEELLNFLKNKNTDLKSLFAFPKVLIKFIQFNTGLPSSAPVERLFSTGGNIMTSKRHRLSDNCFENLVLLKQNNMYV